MKKILFLAFALVLAVGMTAAAADISFSGEVGTEAQWGAGEFDDQYTEGATLDFGATVQVDEFNSLYFDTELGEGVLDVDEFALESDLGGWIGGLTGEALPIGIMYKTGWAEWSYADIADVSAYGNEGLQVGDFTAIGQQFTLTFVDILNVYGAHSFAQADGLEDETGAEDRVELPQMLFGADAMIPIEGVGDLGVEVVYSMFDGGFDTTGDGDDDVTVYQNHLGLAALFAMDIMPDLTGELAASYTMDVTDYDNDDIAPGFYWGVGGAVDYLAGLVGASFSLSAQEDVNGGTGMGLGLGLSSSPVDFLSFDAGLALGLDDDSYEETMNSADVSMTFSPGAAGFTLGYFWLNDEGDDAIGDLNAVSDAGTGIYFSASLEY